MSVLQIQKAHRKGKRQAVLQRCTAFLSIIKVLTAWEQTAHLPSLHLSLILLCKYKNNHAWLKKQTILHYQPVLHAGLQFLLDPEAAGVASHPPQLREDLVRPATTNKSKKATNQSYISNFTPLCRSHVGNW